ncbi:BglG family transcription antiterminator, partial [Niallia taxi]|uniref:BglG family transcription antiterminator n=1 Tax=Niallia taxi TaxID=2499688 RepID=UPI0015F4C999
MYLDERSNKLLKEVLANPDTSNVQLEKKYRLTRRQVSYSFQKINEWLKGNNYPAISRTNGGKFVISPIIMELFAPSDTSAHKKYIASETERAQLISLLLMSGEAELSLIHFTSLLDVSKNTILRDLKNVQKLVDPFQVKVSYSRTNGYELLGSEWNIRKVLLEVLSFILSMYNGKALIEEYMGIADQELEGIKKQMEEVERTLNSRFIDERMEILPYIIAAIFKRIRNGKMIEENGQIDYDSLSDTKEYKATEILIKEGCILPKSERLFITIQLLTSKI